MNLVLFDLDGTQTQTNAVSGECFAKAINQVFQITDIETDWTKYKNVTELGCFDEIIEIAEARAEAAYRGFHTKTYVGDAVWDLQAANLMGFQFVGIGSGNRADDLRARGAKWIVPDFKESGTFLRILEQIFKAEPKNTFEPNS